MTNPDTDTMEYFDCMLPPDQDWFTTKEVAAIIPWGDRFVRDSYKDRKLLGHKSSLRSVDGEERRGSLAIPRAALILFLAETANYTSEDLLDRFCEAVSIWPPGMQRDLRDYLNEELEVDDE